MVRIVSFAYARCMSKRDFSGVVTAEEWDQLGREDVARRGSQHDGDLAGSLLTGLSGLLILAMLVVGPMWTLIAVAGTSNEHSATFDRLWLFPVSLTLAAAVPLALALRRESNAGRWVLAAFLAVSLGIELATFPWL